MQSAAMKSPCIGNALPGARRCLASGREYARLPPIKLSDSLMSSIFFPRASNVTSIRRAGFKRSDSGLALRCEKLLCSAAGEYSQEDQNDGGDQPNGKLANTLKILTGTAIALVVGALIAPNAASLLRNRLQELVTTSVLAKSGFFAALSLIFACEIGDKTFFIAALLAMKCGRLISFLGSTVSLAVMTIISVCIGYAVQRVPTAVESSEAIGRYLSAASLLYFGAKMLFAALKSGDDGGDEFEEAEESVAEAEQSGSISSKGASAWRSFVEVAGIIFIAEWGDRSMLATIALGAAQSPVGVAGGAILGHVIATAIAVVGGAALSERISEKTVGLIGGALFIVFAAATLLGVF